MSERFSLSFTALPEHIDEMGHVNNMVWLQWVQDIAGAHWQALASRDDQAAHIWLVTRHEIDYRGNILLGESVTGETYVPDEPTGARFDRRVDFRNAAGKVIVSARTTWAMIERSSGRLVRVPKRLAGQFMAQPSTSATGT